MLRRFLNMFDKHILMRFKSLDRLRMNTESLVALIPTRMNTSENV